MPVANAVAAQTILPRPRGLPDACSDDSYYLAVRAWATGHADKVVAQYLCVPVVAVRRFVETREWYKVVQLVREEYDDYEIIALTRLSSLALKIVADALERGDPYVDVKTGEVRYKRLTGQVATSMLVQLNEQKHLVVKRNSNLPEDQDIKEELVEIAKALRSIRAREIEHEPARGNERLLSTTKIIDVHPTGDDTVDPD